MSHIKKNNQAIVCIKRRLICQRSFGNGIGCYAPRNRPWLSPESLRLQGFNRLGRTDNGISSSFRCTVSLESEKFKWFNRKCESVAAFTKHVSASSFFSFNHFLWNMKMHLKWSYKMSLLNWTEKWTNHFRKWFSSASSAKAFRFFWCFGLLDSCTLHPSIHSMSEWLEPQKLTLLCDDTWSIKQI